MLTDKKIVIPQTFGKGVNADIKLPKIWRYKSCMVLVDSKEQGQEIFTLLRPAYYASEMIQPCIAQRPFSPLGGKVTLDMGTMWVAVVGVSPIGSTADVINSTLLEIA